MARQDSHNPDALFMSSPITHDLAQFATGSLNESEKMFKSIVS